MTYHEFLELYTRALREVYTPQIHWYSEVEIPQVAAKMVHAIIQDTYNLDSPALKLLMKRLGVRYTRKNIREWVAANIQ